MEIRQYKSLRGLRRTIGSLNPATDRLVFSPFSYDELLERLREVTVVLSDFDGTLVDGIHWVALQPLLPEHIRSQDAQFRAAYHYWEKAEDVLVPPAWTDSERAGRGISRASLEAAWAANTLSGLSANQVTRKRIHDAMQKLKARDGVHELFGLMRQRIIVSFGIKDVIESWLAIQGLKAQVAATELRFDTRPLMKGWRPGPHEPGKDRVCGFNPLSLVTNALKAEVAEGMRKLHGISEGITLTIGDLPHDLEMMNAFGVNVLVLHPEEAAAHLRFITKEPRFPHFFERYQPLIVYGNSLSWLAKEILEARRRFQKQLADAKGEIKEAMDALKARSAGNEPEPENSDQDRNGIRQLA